MLLKFILRKKTLIVDIIVIEPKAESKFFLVFEI